MWKKSLIANSEVVMSPSNNSWDDRSDCSIESNNKLQRSNSKELLMSPGSQISQSDHADTAEGIWSADIEQAFIEAMAIYPPCGRRKIILSEEGKMYGRNELIARYIKLRTGKTRTRKQVSSHIQVLGRRHSKFFSTAAFKFQAFKDHPYLSLNSPVKLPLTDPVDIKRCHTPPDSGKREDGGNVNSFETPIKNISSNECIVRTFLSPLKSSSVFNSTNHLQELPVMEPMMNLDNNNNNNNNNNNGNNKYSSENCSSQFYPDSTFSPSSNNHNNVTPFPYNNTTAFPSVNNTDNTCAFGIPHQYNVYNNTPHDFRQHRCRPTTPTSCYSRPPMAHSYSPYVNQQSWGTPAHYNRSLRSPDRHHNHRTGNTPPVLVDVERNRRTPCLARDLTINSNLKSIESSKLRLIELSAFVESPSCDGKTLQAHSFLHIDQSSYDNTEFETIDINKILDKFPSNKGGLLELFERGPKEGFFLVKFWTNLNINLENASELYFGSSTRFDSHVFCSEIQSSTKVCSFGRQVVERIEKESGHKKEDKFSFEFIKMPMCDYLINFLNKLNQLPERNMMNSVLENFTILQVVTSVETKETLLCLGYVFEVSEQDGDTQHCIYRLV